MWTIYFATNKKSAIEADSEIDGMKVSIKRESENLIVENVNIGNREEASRKAEEVANSFLNTISCKFGVDIYITDINRFEIVEHDGKKTTHVQFSEIGIALDSIKVIKHHTSGNVVEEYDPRKPGKIEIKPSDAAPYYRRARLSSDAFERFRNFYLAAENIADRIRVSKGLGAKKEQELLEAALEECFRMDAEPLKSVAKDVPGFNFDSNLISEVARFLYKGHRCQLNHSKFLEDKKIPFNPENEKEEGLALPLIEFVAKSLLLYEEQSF